MSNKNKPTLSLGAARAADEDTLFKPLVVEPVVEEKPIEIEPEFVSIAGLASQGRDALVDQLRKHMVNSAPKEYEPPKPTERQWSQTEREMEAGRRASERAAAQAAMHSQPKPEASDGYTVPAYRPNDHVPNFDSKLDTERGHKVL